MSTLHHISVASGKIMCLFAHIFIYFSSPRVVSGRQMSCSQGKKKSFAVKIGEGRWRENIWICKCCHSVEPCNEWEMLSPSFIMQRSLLNARQLGLASSLCPPIPPLPTLTTPVISQQLEHCATSFRKTRALMTHVIHSKAESPGADANTVYCTWTHTVVGCCAFYVRSRGTLHTRKKLTASVKMQRTAIQKFGSSRKKVYGWLC